MNISSEGFFFSDLETQREVKSDSQTNYFYESVYFSESKQQKGL